MRNRSRAKEILITIGHTLQRWILGRLVSMFAIAILDGVGLLVLGVPLALILGLIAGVLSFIPTFGPLSAFVPAGLIALSRSPWHVLYVALLYWATQLLDDNLIGPLIQMRMVRLPPVLLVYSQLLLLFLCGFPGLVLAAPITATLLVLIRELYVRDTLGDRAFNSVTYSRRFPRKIISSK